MARLHYYRFPSEIDAHTRYVNGAANLTGECTLGKTTCRGCTKCSTGWSDCQHFNCLDSEDTIGGTTVTNAKKLLKKFGGTAWTEHCERDGGVFEVTDIKLQGNNSSFKYNRHL